MVKTLEGRLLNLRIAEKEDLQLFASWINDLEFFGEYDPVVQQSKAEVEKRLDSQQQDDRDFIIEKKDGAKIGLITHFRLGKQLEIGFALLPAERKKGYCTEDVNIMVDYLFLAKNDVVSKQQRTSITRHVKECWRKLDSRRKVGCIKHILFEESGTTFSCTVS